MEQIVDTQEQYSTPADVQPQTVELSLDDLARVGGGQGVVFIG
jgi:hypothetical protein